MCYQRLEVEKEGFLATGSMNEIGQWTLICFQIRAVLCVIGLLLNSAKKETSSLPTAFILSKLNMCKYVCEHNKIQQLKHKLNKGGWSKSKVTVSIWCSQ